MTNELYMGPKILLQNVQMCKRYEFILKNKHNEIIIFSILTAASEPSSTATIVFPTQTASPRGCGVRVVKELDLKSNGFYPHRFESCPQRFFFPSSICVYLALQIYLATLY